MSTKQLPAEVEAAIKQWTGSTRNILHFWEDEGTYYVVQHFDLLYFLRLFKLGDEYVISQDHECEVGSGYTQMAEV
jgi:hypothetical protein